MRGWSLADPRRRALGRALVHLIRRPSVRDAGDVRLDDVHMDELVRLACYHRVPGLVYRSLLELGVADAWTDRLRGAYQMSALSHVRCLAELERLGELLDDVVPTWMVLKGPILVELAYGDPGARLYSDLDLLFAASDLGTAIATIESAGGRACALNWPMVTELQRAEIPMVLANGMLADVHSHVLITPNARARFAVSIDELIERRRRVRVGSTEVATLDVVDGILYLCQHGSLSGGHQLVWAKDLDQMLVAESPDWDELVVRARRARLGLVAAMQLERARDVLRAPVPVEVIEALAGGLWWHVWRRHERRIGAARFGGEVRTAAMVTAATSQNTGASLRQLGRAVHDEVVHPTLAGLRATGEREAPDLYRPIGGDVGRAAYLSEAAAGGWR